jgi:N-methylhydantoinase A/acetophenone carboxylase
MDFRVGIDIGGTFTDFASAADDGRTLTCKVPTTHYDLSVGFMRGIRELARRAGLDASEYLSRVEALRYSTTIGTNALIERTGPKLGLITTAGFEDTIRIGRARSWADGLPSHEVRDLARIVKPEPLISPDMVVGVRERIDCRGEVVRPLTREDVLEQLQKLVDRGAMGFVVCLLWSFLNPIHERAIREIIEEEYPEDYLGAMPVVLSSEVSPKSGEYTRTMTAVVNAYIHGVMSDALGRLGSELRDEGYRKPLLLVHSTGGSKKVSRTRAVVTHNAGPVAGMHGAVELGRSAGFEDMIFTDMGGTSFDIGVVAGGELRAHDFIPVIDRWRTNIPAIDVKSIGAGGGSVAWVNEIMQNALQVGPQSAGSMPGPACYDQGGSAPTVTDADLLLGYLDPENYLGGAIPLDVDLARAAIEEKIAAPLGIGVLEAASRIRRLVDARMGQEVFNEVVLKGHDPRRFVILACGGAGPTHACGFAPYIGARAVVVPAMASVFGAFGAAHMEIRQVWDASRTLRLFRWDRQAYLEDLGAFNAVVEELTDLAVRDLRLEGYPPERVRLRLELDMRYGSQHHLTRVETPRLTLRGTGDARELCDLFTRRYSETYSPEAAFPIGGINVECFHLTASVTNGRRELRREAPGKREPEASARLGDRPAWLDASKRLVDTPVYCWERLTPGDRIPGPAIVEALETTYVIEAGWIYQMDAFRSGILERRGQP